MVLWRGSVVSLDPYSVRVPVVAGCAIGLQCLAHPLLLVAGGSGRPYVTAQFRSRHATGGHECAVTILWHAHFVDMLAWHSLDTLWLAPWVVLTVTLSLTLRLA